MIVIIGMPAFIRRLTRSGRVVDDVHKSPPTRVASPAGPLLFVGLLAGELAAYLTFGSLIPVAIMGAAAIAFAIGFADDLYVLGGLTKPLLLLLAGLPLVALVFLEPDLYTSSLNLPILGPTSEHFTIYTALVVVSFPIVANAFNMMDSFNGQVSGFTILTTMALLFAVVLKTVYTPGFTTGHLASVLPLLAVAIGLFVFNRFPSKVFDGDSGALMFGAVYAGLAVTSGVEIAAVIAIVPSILNSFYILSSVRGVVERRRMRGRPTYIGEDGRLYASTERDAPATLVRMFLFDGPMTEQELVRSIIALTLISCILSVITALLTPWSVVPQ